MPVAYQSTAKPTVVDCVWNVMVHAQKPDFVFRRNGRVHLNRRGRQFSQLLAAEVCASAVVILDTPSSEIVWEYWLPTPFASFPFTSPPVRHRVPSGFRRTLQYVDITWPQEHYCNPSRTVRKQNESNFRLLTHASMSASERNVIDEGPWGFYDVWWYGMQRIPHEYLMNRSFVAYTIKRTDSVNGPFVLY
jgi:hypothetical protein